MVLGETGEVYIVSDQFLMLSESRFFENAVFQQRVETLGSYRNVLMMDEEYSGILSRL